MGRVTRIATPGFLDRGIVTRTHFISSVSIMGTTTNTLRGLKSHNVGTPPDNANSSTITVKSLKILHTTDKPTCLNSPSDIIPGTYEGGFKTWECTFDLINLLIESPEVIPENARVLDLGCGSGYAGIAVLKLHPSATVCFHDYNEEVIENLTIPNVCLNETDLSRVSFFSGDWDTFRDRPFDVIISSETIYAPQNVGKIINLLSSCLQGSLYLASKTYYFGVGGGTNQFKSEVAAHGGFTTDVVRQFKQGVSREIVRVSVKKD